MTDDFILKSFLKIGGSIQTLKLDSFMTQTHTNLSVTNAIVTIVHSILAPSGIDLKPSLDSKAGIDVSTTPLATTRRALDGKRGVGTIYDDPKTSFELLPNSEALRNFFYLWRQYDKLNGATKAEFMYASTSGKQKKRGKKKAEKRR